MLESNPVNPGVSLEAIVSVYRGLKENYEGDEDMNMLVSSL